MDVRERTVIARTSVNLSYVNWSLEMRRNCVYSIAISAHLHMLGVIIVRLFNGVCVFVLYNLLSTMLVKIECPEKAHHL